MANLKKMFAISSSNDMPIFTAVNQVLFPGGPLILEVTSKQQENLVVDVSNGLKFIGVVPVKNESQTLAKGDIGTCGLAVKIITTRTPTGKVVDLLVFGFARFVVRELVSVEPYPKASINIHHEQFDIKENQELASLSENVNTVALPILNNLPPTSLLHHLANLKTLTNSPSPVILDVCMSCANITFDEKLEILRTLDTAERLKKGYEILKKIADSKGDAYSKDEVKISEQMPVIKIYGPASPKGMLNSNDENDLVELQKRLDAAKLPEYAKKVVSKEMARLRRSFFSHDYSVVRNYLDFIADLPWSISSQEKLDIHKAREELDFGHYGMQKVKRRVLEYLAVRLLNKNLKGPTLCLLGPPGVGKTSIGITIAAILNRRFHRISLGGVTHQSDIRGHRMTYVGSMPGRIIQGIKLAGTNNPVILLDEIDKMGGEAMGDPAAALLEVLDPEQNSTFTDHYLNMPFDLSQITFLATANTTATIPLPLLDRMELIRLSGYTEEEKFHIATKHLMKKQLDQHGLSEDSILVTDGALKIIINEYTKEAGVRSLDRNLAALCRYVAVKVAEKTYRSLPIVIKKDDVQDILGVAPYLRDEVAKVQGLAGVAVGLAWTPSGGTLTLVEASKQPGGSGHLVLTGSLGKVMKESAQLALNWVRAVAYQYGILDEEGSDLLSETDVHVHFPMGAVGKDGPSAGITVATALMSLFSGLPVLPNLALSGELTLQGIVLPVGGIKEKLMAAHRNGMLKVILPLKCQKDLSDVPADVLSNMEIVLVSNMSEVLDTAFNGALTRKPRPTLLASKL